MSQRIRVVCRKRPMNRKETFGRQNNVVGCVDGAVLVREPKLKVDLTKYTEEHTFQFDNAFDEDISNEDLYDSSVRPLVGAFVSSQAKCTCFAYGQTGSGKTYVPFLMCLHCACRFTMLGNSSNNDNSVHGIFPLAVYDLFSQLPEDVNVCVSFYEIYCGKLFDLLNGRRHLHARENARGNVILQGITEFKASSAEQLISQVFLGLTARTTGVTGANVDSSRSHAIIQITLKKGLISTGAKLSFIDLAGSERGADTVEQDKQTRLDGAEINKSLLALKECIRALDQQLDHTPFRGSKLTQVLKDSFVGSNCLTLMIANISPSSGSVEHTLNTLRYAYRVRELRGKRTVKNSEEISSSSESREELITTPKTPAGLLDASNTSPPIRNEAGGALENKKNGSAHRSLSVQHDRLIGVILSEEEALISAHRADLELAVELLNEEMAQVNLIDQPGSDIDLYVKYMDKNIQRKEEMLANMKQKLAQFKHHLREEESLSALISASK